MRRREYLRAGAGTAGLAGLAGLALSATGSAADGQPPVESAATDDPFLATTATDPKEIPPLGHVDVSNGSSRLQATEAVTTPDGRYAFVTKLDGFHVVDLADPSNPEIVATREDVLADDGGPMSDIKDLTYDDERVLLMTDYGREFRGIAMFDVSDPTDPTLAASYETGYPIHNGDLAGDHAYLTTGEALDVVDVAGDEPESVATWSVVDYDETYRSVDRNLRNLHDVYVQDGRAYLAYWDSGSWILDVTDPADPAYVGHVAARSAEELAALDGSAVRAAFFEPPGNDHYAQPNDDGSLLAVGKESWNYSANDGGDTDDGTDAGTDVDGTDDASGDGGDVANADSGGPSGIALWDVTDPAEPVELSYIEPPSPPAGEPATYEGYWTTAHNFDIVGDVLYSSWYRAGVKVHDISDPENPVELAAWGDGAETSFWTARSAVPGDFFVGNSYWNPTADGAPGGLYTFPDPTGDGDIGTPTGTDEPTPTATESPTETPAEPPTDAAATSTETAAPTATATPAESETATAASETTDAASTSGPTEVNAETVDGTTDGDGPGFGPLAALAGLGLGVWHRFGADDGSEE